MTWCKFLWVILARPSRYSTTGTSSSGTSGSRCFSLILLHERIRRRIRLCQLFPRLLISWRRLQLFPLGHCPLDSHCQRSPRILRPTLFCPMILDHGVLLKISISGAHILNFVYLARYFFLPLSSICYNQVQPSSDGFPGRTIAIRSWVYQTLVFLICTILARYRQVESLSLLIKFRPVLYRIPKNHHFGDHQ